MHRTLIHGMVLRAKVTHSAPARVEAVSLDQELMTAADLRPGERVVLSNVSRGVQAETYVLPAAPGSGILAVSGAASHCADAGDVVVLTSYAAVGPDQLGTHTPYIVHVDAGNRIVGAGGAVPEQEAAESFLPLPVLAPPWSLHVAGSVPGDVEELARWMNSPHIAPAWGRAWPVEGWRAEVERQVGSGTSWPCLVAYEGRTFGYVEIYDVAADPLGGYYRVRDGDVGVHIALVNPLSRGLGLGPELLRTVSDAVLRAHPERRVVAEPDATDLQAVLAFQKAGFGFLEEVTLPGKTAALLAKEKPGV